MQHEPSQKKQKNGVRNARIRTLAAEGKTQSQIAETVGLCRETVNRVLNSEESRRIVAEAESQLTRLSHKAITALEAALDNPSDQASAVRAAGIVLKALGLDQKIKDDRTEIPKPFIMKLIDGGEIIMGHANQSDLDALDRLGLRKLINPS